MSKRKQAPDKNNAAPKRETVDPEQVQEPAQEQAAQFGLSKGAPGVGEEDPSQRLASQLSDSRFPPVQRQAAAIHIGKIAGNRTLGRLLGARGPVGKSPLLASRSDDVQAERGIVQRQRPRQHIPQSGRGPFILRQQRPAPTAGGERGLMGPFAEPWQLQVQRARQGGAVAELELINRALQPVYRTYPHLRFPVVMFSRSHPAIFPGAVLYDPTPSSHPGQTLVAQDPAARRGNSRDEMIDRLQRPGPIDPIYVPGASFN